MRRAVLLFLTGLLVGAVASAQTGRSQAPKKRGGHKATSHKMQQLTRDLSPREKQLNAQLKSQRKGREKLAKQQMKDARKNTHKVQALH